jgi:hypothetical protein
LKNASAAAGAFVRVGKDKLRMLDDESCLWTLRQYAASDPSLTTPKLKKTFGAPCTQDDSLLILF